MLRCQRGEALSSPRAVLISHPLSPQPRNEAVTRARSVSSDDVREGLVRNGTRRQGFVAQGVRASAPPRAPFARNRLCVPATRSAEGAQVSGRCRRVLLGRYLVRVSRSRPLFALALLAVAVAGTAVAPAVHWAGHGADGHETPVEIAGGTTHADGPEETGHAGECPDCANLQKTLGPTSAVLSLQAVRVEAERTVILPEAHAVRTDVATPEGRGPPAV